MPANNLPPTDLPLRFVNTNHGENEIRFPDQSAGNRRAPSVCSASLSPCDLTANAASKRCPVPKHHTPITPASIRPTAVDGAIQCCPASPGWSHRPVSVILSGHLETAPVVLPWAFYPTMSLSSEPIPPVGYH